MDERDLRRPCDCPQEHAPGDWDLQDDTAGDDD